MPQKSVIIIGAGVAGLSAGCYARMNGYPTRIFELHDLPGGLCTSWERSGYVFDGCLHYLFGTGEGQAFNQMWKELGVLPGPEIYDHHELMHIVDVEGHRLVVYADPDRLAAHMKELSPDDAGLIDDMCTGVRQFLSFDLSALQETPKALMSPQQWARLGKKMMPYVPSVMKWGLLSAHDFGQKFKHPFLQRAVPLMFAWPEAPVMVGMQLLASLHTGNAGFPAGGSLPVARALERRYLELGGELFYKAQVEKILVEDGRAVGVRLYNDEIHRADVIISTADGHGTLFDLLGQEYVSKDLRERYGGRLPIKTLIQASFGVDRDMRGECQWTHLLLPEPVLIGGQAQTYLSIKQYGFDPSFAPPGKASVVVVLPSPYTYWQRIYGRKLYDTEQIQVEAQVLDQLELFYPGIKSQVEVSDVATPLSYERYTGSWQGSSCGWLLTRETMMMMIQGMDKTIPDLEQFFMAGQWVEPGGSVPVVAASGRNVVRVLCHQDGREFTTSLPQSQAASS
jgi:phytoene dehydrogenase-like protein